MTRNLRLIVCGGRNYKSRATVFDTLDLIHTFRIISVIIQGDCKTGADRFAREWCASRKVRCIGRPAKWNKFGLSAGPRRNGQMMRFKPHGTVAFAGGKGTQDMISKSERGGVGVMRV